MGCDREGLACRERENALDADHIPGASLDSVLHARSPDMSEWVEINGAKIEKSFFDQNVEEARSYDWSLSDTPDSGKGGVTFISPGVRLGFPRLFGQ